ncbi:hypothetical protein BH23CHL8_BH23CHL8_28360 [soil metagenome]
MQRFPAPPTDHARHDELLVARFGAHDELPEEERATAARLVAACAACAVLSADLSLVARAVAREPMPPRRRDFRITPEQAVRLRGSAVQRFLRRFTLPESAMLRPAAAGVMSLGLLLVVAGSFLPLGGEVGSGGESLSRPRPAADALATQVAGEESQEIAARSSTKVTEPDEFADTSAREEDSQGLEMSALQAAPDDEVAASPMRVGAAEADAVPESGPALEMAQGPGDEQPAVDGSADAAGLEGDAASATGARLDLGALLVVLGAVLALGGLVILLLVMLARRVAVDPLVR